MVLIISQQLLVRHIYKKCPAVWLKSLEWISAVEDTQILLAKTCSLGQCLCNAVFPRVHVRHFYDLLPDQGDGLYAA